MDYIRQIRKKIGSDMLLTVGCGVILEKGNSILLQHRKDEDSWCIPGGLMEIGETFEEAAKREVFEETGLIVENLELFGIYSGENGFATYPNGDKVYGIQIIFQSKVPEGEIRTNKEESHDHQFFETGSLPENLTLRQQAFIFDWQSCAKRPIVK
ncbi:NUDIX hydrolase [Paenisporosarcina cavernae]|uniref:NUDIX domain-containing protein n=1 Tax=Paenisporosarcina cavernae TaxID=2320858 RepID=A0A385YTT4_9BACL|nr:NUDIX domain-containing protein [Paenisporosarcina cavernae]AYC30269.1 NUDIX domain-containing protein [Paenisporosarcina cavernae]